MAGKFAIFASALLAFSVAFANEAHGHHRGQSPKPHKIEIHKGHGHRKGQEIHKGPEHHKDHKVHQTPVSDGEIWVKGLPPRDVTSLLAEATRTWIKPATIKSASLKVIAGSTTVMPTIAMTEAKEAAPQPTYEAHEITTKVMLDHGPVCGLQDRDLIDSCVGSTFIMDCDMDDASCLCKAYTSMVVCFGTCPMDPRFTSAKIERNKYCNMALAEPTPTILAHPVMTVTEYLVKTSTKPKDVTPIHGATKIIYDNNAGTVTVWTGKAGHTHIPTIVAKKIDGKVVYSTVNAKPTNGATNFKAPNLAAAVGGALGIAMAAL